MKIAVYGSARDTLADEVKEKAKTLGTEIAKHGAILITGACAGLPHIAVQAASKAGGKCIGYSPATSLEEHLEYGDPTEGFSKFVFVPKEYTHASKELVCRKYRNISTAAECDAAIIICGRTGTLNEFTNVYDFGKIIGVLEGSGGITDGVAKAVYDVASKNYGSQVVFESDPVSLVKELVKLVKQKKN